MNEYEKRKEKLKKMGYGTLQSQKEFKDYLNNYIYSESKLFNEVEYILKKSLEDSEAPYSYDDCTNMTYFDFDEAKRAYLEELTDEDDDVQKEIFTEINDEYDRKVKTVGDVEVFLNSLDDDDLQEFLEKDTSLCFDLYDYERQAEVMQWFIMDCRIIEALDARQEVTLNGFVWGRQCCGQAIEIDGVIIDIFKEWYLNLYGVKLYDEEGEVVEE